MPRRLLRKAFWGRHLAVFTLILTALLNTALIVELVTTNGDRIDDIQRARVESCRRTYEGVRQIFQPFLAKSPDRKGVQIFNSRVDDLKAQCPAQVHVNPGGNP